VGLAAQPPLSTLESAVGPEIVVNGRRYINFGGSSYLSLASRPEIIEAGIATLRECGAGAPLSRSHRVFTRAHQDVEREAAQFFETQAAYYVSSGYYFGFVALAALGSAFNAIFYDERSHYSLKEAIAASRLRSYAFRHVDAEDLRAKLRQHLNAGERPLVVTDGLFSTFGEIAPLQDYAEAMAPYEGRLVVDESHSFGVLGATGRGAREHFALPPSSTLIGGSLGKAFGACGGVLPSTAEEVANFRLTPVGRGASAGLPAAAAMCAGSLRFIREHPEQLRRLRENVAYLKSGLRKLGLDVGDSIVPVATFVPSSGKAPQTLKEELLNLGLFVYRSTYIGAGPEGVIRCGIFADHTREHMDTFMDVLGRLL
jgi:8-amino-7-oxononanoate synthase